MRTIESLLIESRDHWDDALLFRDLATLRTDADVFDTIDELEWKGPTRGFAALCEQLGDSVLFERVSRLTP